ncbi:hypothetical protein RM553_19065 [Zunongwangia sp. F363]|uniref:Uncharacterized protein n=1 Tax=Autumnicola tepida TaxID=3075595 RepID=A0ABU3CF63_9FLAO|nr:hypothetical protein [Zunongwangia sp. F363]MDT0644941.1 hypothetical protein [Zunongwangia sp. F363]
MIPDKIKNLFNFIDFLDSNKKKYVEDYVPLCSELEAIKFQQKKLNPQDNYIDKQEFDNLQSKIDEEFNIIKNNVCLPVNNKLTELQIWLGDNNYTSIYNSNIETISNFKRNFSPEDVFEVFNYKEKYIEFRKETNSDFLCLSLVFDYLDRTLKEIFDFFKDSNKNEFEDFEAKIIEVDSLEEVLKGLRENNTNVRYSVPTKNLLKDAHKQTIPLDGLNIKNEIIMGDKIEAKNISNNKGPISVGKKNTTGTSHKNDLSKKSFRWQKWGIIITVILAIIAIIVTILVS